MQAPAITDNQRKEYRKQLNGILYPPKGYLLTESDKRDAKRLGYLLGIEIRLSRVRLDTNQEIDLETGEVIREF